MPKYSNNHSMIETPDEKILTESTDALTDITKILEGSDGGEVNTAGSWQTVYSPTTVTMPYQPNKGVGRYKQSLKHLLPVRVKTGPGSSMPVDQTGAFSFILFSWLTPLIWRAYRNGLNIADVYYCSPFESAKVNGARLSVIWDRVTQCRSREIPFRHVLFRFISTRYIVACFAYTLCLAFGFVGPTLFLRMLLEFAESPIDNHIEGLIWTAGLILCEMLRILSFVTLWAVNCRTAIRANAGVTALLFRKVMRLRVTNGKTTGEIINHFSNDANKIMLMVYTSPLIIGGPMVLVAALIYTWWLIGIHCLVSVAVFSLAYIFQFGISKINSHFQRKAIGATESRVSLMREILSYIKLVKFYAWERPFKAKISDLRQNERNLLENCQFLLTINTSVTVLIPVLSTILTIVSFTIFGNNLHSSEAFTLLMINVITAHGLRTLPLCFRDIVNGFIALDRIEKFLQTEEKSNYTNAPSKSELAIYVAKATLSWPVINTEANTERLLTANNKVTSDGDIEDQTTLVIPLTPQPALLDVTFSLPVGQLFGVCGSIGSGKSSLLSALLGQMQLVNGQVSLKSSCAYVAQQSWILNATLKENILFGQPFNSKRYYEAVYCCSLTEDFAALPHGDQTEIGESGMNLSGGQKQRLSLARALYANKDLYLLDDPLSAVDVNVGRHIFQHCIKGALRGKSILMVTQQLQYLSECDKVLFMHNGQIVEEGTHEALCEKNAEYQHYISNINNDSFNINLNMSREISQAELTPDSGTDFDRSRSSSQLKSMTSLNSIADSIDDVLTSNNIMTEEEMVKGNISVETYQAYIHAAGGYIVCSIVLLWFAFQSGLLAFSNWWLSYWLRQGSGEDLFDDNTGLRIPTNIIDNPKLNTYESVYGFLVLGMLGVRLVLGFLFIKTTFRASSKFHDNLVYRIMRCPMRFFETVPSGRIINIFTSDLEEVDITLPTVMGAFLQDLTAIIFSLIIVAYVFSWFYIAIVFIVALFFLLYRVFRIAVRDLKRIECIARAPMYSHISTTVQGLATIQAFQRQEEFIERFSNLVDQHSSPLYLYYSSLRWLSARTDFLCLVILLLVCLMAVYLKHQVDSAFSALAIVIVMQLSGTMQYLVRIACDVEGRFTSVERIYNYTEKLESEALSVVEKTRPAPDWPTRGRLSFRDVSMRYRPGLQYALKSVTFDISPQEKIGIVGRTGAGKSSIGSALFRLVELVSGTIHIDGVDISQLGLEDLRSRLSIIPQDPILFQGTVRQNLDPLNAYDDSELWDALEKSHLHQKISSFNGGLEAPVSDKGENFSVGELQLLCLARSILRHSRIVVLDEATASVDGETDNLIQNTISDVFAGCTVLIIAHRINTVINCDRVMVMEEGRVVEFDTPAALLANPKSRFAQFNEVTRL